ncbi:MAG: GAF domain-containing protein [Blastocatellia bacterium]|nr:GAF domain-containing protein [Blastocatellia bacterium]
MKLDNLLSVASHLLIALLVAFGHEAVKPAPGWVQVLLLVLLSIIIVALLRAISNRVSKSAMDILRGELTAENDKLKAELEKQDRYNHLRRTMPDVVADFIRERYRANYSLTVELRRLIESKNVNIDSIRTALNQADNIRREKVKQALGRVSQILKEDIFKKPKDADGENNDKMGVSFYAVTSQENGPDILEKRYRAFPNEGEPKTPKFDLNEGAAGKCWAKREPIVCENGGEDLQFEEMRTGQKKDYASMICVPAVADFPKEKISEVYGVLTVHATERRGYFQQSLVQFWFDIFQPVCDALIYSGKSSELIDAIGDSFASGLKAEENR